MDIPEIYVNLCCNFFDISKIFVHNNVTFSIFLKYLATYIVSTLVRYHQKDPILGSCRHLAIYGAHLWSPMMIFLVEPGGTPLFGVFKVFLLAMCRLCFMYNSAKVSKCYIVHVDGTDKHFCGTVRRAKQSQIMYNLRLLTFQRNSCPNMEENWPVPQARSPLGARLSVPQFNFGDGFTGIKSVCNIRYVQIKLCTGASTFK